MSDYLSRQFGLHGKVAVVTGASRGLGQGIAMALGEAGATVIAIGSSTKSVESTVNLLTQKDVVCVGYGCDQSNTSQIIDTIDKIIENHGRIDVLVNNAGTIKRSPAHEFSDEDWNEVINVNLNGVFTFCREAGKQMLKQGSGKIINIASLLSFSGGITVPAYAASKGGVAQLTKALANEWASKNIQVNAIAPGYFETDNTFNIRQDKERFESISSRIPAVKWGQPDDLAGAAIFLSSKASSYVNGHVLLVDGGWMAR
ncbi:SDR family oxidoreductase [Alteromonas sp. KUL106]|uniref:SDR family oxidoreductase n=1 Tax=Alteromonas sp. KUL106 TaxID=2480799 RepID=UPI0012E5ADA8|nr:SDR family oxidoreductase [Alteromonas sp. KUL106]GFD68643.1 2-dehydro-3-deoxy-D-gluconate 5-dehydrogenase [Alteromonas sp. KUL106]GFD79441.1 2-dehydro-3-deoxy-D-gluconate 5-dehydrogenase [Tenacibaculum sp. KUL118]